MGNVCILGNLRVREHVHVTAHVTVYVIVQSDGKRECHVFYQTIELVLQR